jgi:surface protein
MFYGCGQLEEIDMSKWDTSSVTTTYHMFADCKKLKFVNMTDWNTPNLTNMDGMFNDCNSLESVDLSDLDTQNVEDMSQLFEYCYSLKEIKGFEKLDFSKVWDFKEMFFSCESLETLDLSSWNTPSAEQTYRMFRDCYALKTIYVGDGWDMSKVNYSSEMFTGSSSLVGANGTVFSSSYTDVTYARVDTAETPGYLTYKSAT